jgi:glycerophosphoryl diester phosphodiesterase
LVDDLKAKNIRVWINAFGDVDKSLTEGRNDLLLEFLENGANVLQTDQPEKLLSALKNEGLQQ